MPYARPSTRPPRDRRDQDLRARRRTTRQRHLRRLLRDIRDDLLLERSFKTVRRGRFSYDHLFDDPQLDGELDNEGPSEDPSEETR